ncbi:MAG: hypothetical protein R3Y53_00925 [Bacillota bacterium]
MKRSTWAWIGYTCLVCIVVFFIFLYMGYQSIPPTAVEEEFVMIEDRIGVEIMTPEAPVEIAESVAVNKELTLQPHSEIVYEYLYTKDNITKAVEQVVEPFVVGMSQEELEDVFLDWQVVSFSEEEVVLRKSIQGKSDEVYVIGQIDGYIATFYEDENKVMRLMEVTQIPLSILPEYEQRQLREGIFILGEENLLKLMADFST